MISTRSVSWRAIQRPRPRVPRARGGGWPRRGGARSPCRCRTPRPRCGRRPRRRRGSAACRAPGRSRSPRRGRAPGRRRARRSHCAPRARARRRGPRRSPPGRARAPSSSARPLPPLSVRRRPPVECEQGNAPGVSADPRGDGPGTQLSGGPADGENVSEVLSQSEIDALLNAMSSGDVDAVQMRDEARRATGAPLRLPAPEQVLEGPAAHHRAAPRDLLPHRPEPALGPAAGHGRDRGRHAPTR